LFEEANQEAVEKIKSAQPVLVNLKPAGKVIPRMNKNTILQAGPPIEWERMCGPLRGAVYGALMYEELAETPEEAEELIKNDEILFAPCHEHDSVGPMAGVISASMPVFVVENKEHENFSYCSMNEGLGRVLRFGAYGEEVIRHLKWMEMELGPSLELAIKRSGGINLKTIISQALHMGDECHNRNVAATSLFERKIMPYLIEANLETRVTSRIAKFWAENDHFFLNLSMAACKAMMDTAHDIENCTLITAMSRNGTEFGIKVSSLGDQWFTAPAPTAKGLYFPGYGPADANPDLGDSSITETRGIGGFAMAAAPALVKFVGGTPADAVSYTKEMMNITVTKDYSFTIPSLNFEGTPIGIDVLKVLNTGILPIINTGIAHKKPDKGQIGAGIVRAPMECFKKALKALVEKA
jgi:hypothetical protein